MQATSRGKQFVIDHRTLAVAVAIVALIAVASGIALLTTADTTDRADAQSVADEARPSGLHLHYPTDRSRSMTGVTQPDDASDYLAENSCSKKEVQLDAMDDAQVATPAHNFPTERSRSTHSR